MWMAIAVGCALTSAAADVSDQLDPHVVQVVKERGDGDTVDGAGAHGVANGP